MSIKDKITIEYLDNQGFTTFNDNGLKNSLGLWDLKTYSNDLYPGIILQQREDRPGYEFFKISDYGSPVNKETILTEGDFEFVLMTVLQEFRI